MRPEFSACRRSLHLKPCCIANSQKALHHLRSGQVARPPVPVQAGKGSIQACRLNVQAQLIDAIGTPPRHGHGARQWESPQASFQAQGGSGQGWPPSGVTALPEAGTFWQTLGSNVLYPELSHDLQQIHARGCCSVVETLPLGKPGCFGGLTLDVDQTNQTIARMAQQFLSAYRRQPAPAGPAAVRTPPAPRSNQVHGLHRAAKLRRSLAQFSGRGSARSRCFQHRKCPDGAGQPGWFRPGKNNNRALGLNVHPGCAVQAAVSVAHRHSGAGSAPQDLKALRAGPG